ncbi:hypothetical protein K457DRAFT_76792 [Linnemannia elongata AG-77]|uniref:Mediator of RNA polymerase II transcription subunit 22 n=1 Tax=Linnemannia elongata AG-77 TaxID=1314771 RepID=A0A197JUG1_9FUNG|nr:hypothetical protein K457DRAFT_76792 [Linnemannia elongata AG-77]
MPGGVGGVGGAPGQVAGAGNPVIGGGGVAAGGVAGGAAGNAAGGAAGAGGATRNTNLSALQEIEEAYNKRLDMDVAQLMESFGDIIKTAESLTQSKDKYKLAQESYQIQGRAANIVSSAESLLAMVTELKQTLLLNDTTTLAQLSTQRQQELSSQKTAVKQRVMGLKEEVDKTIWELEQACYGSSSSSIGVSTTEEAMV